jgi:hypothetical protein
MPVSCRSRRPVIRTSIPSRPTPPDILQPIRHELSLARGDGSGLVGDCLQTLASDSRPFSSSKPSERREASTLVALELKALSQRTGRGVGVRVA